MQSAFNSLAYEVGRDVLYNQGYKVATMAEAVKRYALPQDFALLVVIDEAVRSVDLPLSVQQEEETKARMFASIGYRLTCRHDA